MRRTIVAAGLAVAVVLAWGHESAAQRGRGGGGRAVGGGRVGAISPGGYGGRVASPAVSPYGGGAGASYRSSAPVVGARGGTGAAHQGGGSYTTQRGGTIEYKGAGIGGTTPGGVTVGRGVGGAQITTAGGHTINHVGAVGGAVGPGGNAVGGRSGVTVGTGAGGGSFSTAYRGGVAVGPHGAAAGGVRVGTATNAAGHTVSGAARAGAAVGPYGAVAGGARVAATPSGTYYRSAAAVRGQAVAVRQSFYGFAKEYPVLAARWVGPTWRPVAWSALASYGGYPAEPVYYDYGESVVYSGDTVIVNGDHGYSADLYAQQATDLATAGKEAKADPKADDFQPLGVFAMVKGDETSSSNIFQLAVNKAGVIRGEYYNALTDTTDPVYGSVDKKTQRAAWTVGDRKTPVYEAGIANLTRDEATMLVHFGKDNRQQLTLVRIPQPTEEPKPK